MSHASASDHWQMTGFVMSESVAFPPKEKVLGNVLQKWLFVNIKEDLEHCCVLCYNSQQILLAAGYVGWCIVFQYVNNIVGNICLYTCGKLAPNVL